MQFVFEVCDCVIDLKFNRDVKCGTMKRKYDEKGRLVLDEKRSYKKMIFAMLGLVLTLGPILLTVFLKLFN